jgi:hypothetical protein
MTKKMLVGGGEVGEGGGIFRLFSFWDQKAIALKLSLKLIVVFIKRFPELFIY